MKKFLSIGSVLVLLTLAVLPGVAFADAGTDASFDISLDGYCDGLHINTYPDGTVDGNQTGCVTGPLLGTKGPVLNQGRAFTIGFDDSASYVGFLFVVRLDQTWTIYANTGGGIYVINAGTWSYGTPLAGDAPRSAGSGANLGSASIDASFDLTFDGYCDGLHLNVFGDGTADGSQIGCVTGPVLGTRNRVFAQGHAISITYDTSAAYVGLFTVIRADHTWTIYANDGGGIYVINSGTWSKGAPPLGGMSSAAVR